MENSVENIHSNLQKGKSLLAIDWHPTQWELESEYGKKLQRHFSTEQPEKCLSSIVADKN